MSTDEFEFDPTRPSLAAITDAGHAFSIPWNRNVRGLMAGFDSTRIQKASGPWVMSSPFDLTGARLSAIIPDTRGGTASFHDGFSTQSGSSEEHLSAALGITVGYPFLNASVSGKYDQHVMNNKHGVQASRNSSCRVGRIVLDRRPSLSASAIELLHSKDGAARFKAMYGDYYICGYELGADAGACMSASTAATSSKETLEITVAVKLLFYTASTTHTESKSSSSSSSTLTFCGYHSLEGSTDMLTSNNMSTWEQAQLQKTAAEYLAKVGSLDAEVRSYMSLLGLKDGQRLPLSTCSLICNSGLVVQLLLAPFARLNQYIRHAGRMQTRALE